MLRFGLADHLLIEAQEAYLGEGTSSGARTADHVRQMRRLFRALAANFNHRQSAEPGLALGDGRLDTVYDEVIGPYASAPWPARSARILTGISLYETDRLPGLPCRPDGETYHDLDPHSYLTRLDDGPVQERRFGRMTGLVAYLDLVCATHLVWLGREEDIEQAKDAFRERTAGLTDWRDVDPAYQQALVDRCGGT